MSSASAIGQVIFSQKVGVYMAALQSDKGDLYQEFQGSAAEPTNIAPNFATLLPTLSFVLISSRVAEGVVTPKSMKWYFNDVLLTFTNNVSTNLFGGETGHFKFIPAPTGGYFGLQIVKNLVKASGASACTIRSEATIEVGNVSDTVQCVYSIPMTLGLGNAKNVTIMAGDNKFFTITDKGGPCILRAIARVGADEITSGLTYAWYQLKAGVWTAISGATSRDLKVTETMIDTSGLFKVEVSQSGTLLGMDTQTVMDASDPFDILTNPSPESETISESGDTVVYSPILTKRGSTSKYKDMTFYFVFMDAAGNILNPSTATTPALKGTVTHAMCVQAGGNVSYLISTVE